MIATSDHIQVQKEAGVLSLTMNRPEKKNALTQDMYAALADNVVAAQTDPEILVVLITGTGDSFTAGNDLGDFAGSDDTPKGENELPPVGRYLQAILNAEKPIVAAVNGLAIGVGVTMLLHCDLVYASPNATVCSIFDEDALLDEASSRAHALAAKAPNAVKLTKQLVRQDHANVAQQMADESVHFSAQLKTAEFAEAAMAFAERRAPDFSKI